MPGKTSLGVTQPMPPEDEDNQQSQLDAVPVDSKWTPKPNQFVNPTSAHTVKRPPEGWLSYLSPEQNRDRIAKKLNKGDRMTVYPGGGYFVSVKKEFREWLAKRIAEIK